MHVELCNICEVNRVGHDQPSSNYKIKIKKRHYGIKDSGFTGSTELNICDRCSKTLFGVINTIENAKKVEPDEQVRKIRDKAFVTRVVNEFVTTFTSIIGSDSDDLDKTFTNSTIQAGLSDTIKKMEDYYNA